MIILCNITSVCEGFNAQYAKDNHSNMIAEYLQSNLPNLKTAREQLVYEIKLLEKNVKEMNRLSQSFSQEESKKMISSKLMQLKDQHRILTTQLSKLDNEVEKNIAHYSFNQIDGGGTRLDDLRDILHVTEFKINTAKKINSMINHEK